MTHDVLVGLVTGDPEDPQTRIAPGLDPGKISEAGGAVEAFFPNGCQIFCVRLEILIETI